MSCLVPVQLIFSIQESVIIPPIERKSDRITVSKLDTD